MVQKKILLPFIQLRRRKYYNWTEGNDIPADLIAVCWYDGSNIQPNAIMKEKQQDLDVQHKILSCKHSRRQNTME